MVSKTFMMHGCSTLGIDLCVDMEREFGLNPVRFENQHLRGYHWWLYPNYDAGKFSKVYARVNVLGDLVVGRGSNTRLVCIINGVLVLRKHIRETAVSADDARLLVCL